MTKGVFNGLKLSNIRELKVIILRLELESLTDFWSFFTFYVQNQLWLHIHAIKSLNVTAWLIKPKKSSIIIIGLVVERLVRSCTSTDQSSVCLITERSWSILPLMSKKQAGKQHQLLVKWNDVACSIYTSSFDYKRLIDINDRTTWRFAT